MEVSGFMKGGYVYGFQLKSDLGQVRQWGDNSVAVTPWHVLGGPIVGIHWQHDGSLGTVKIGVKGGEEVST